MKYFLDLFSGIGGFALGAYWAKLQFDNHYFSEVDPYAIRVYQQRFPDAEPLGDIRGIRGPELPSGEWIIAGGFPCQDISVAGKGAGLDGSRSGLWYEYARIIGELRPRFAIMENVGALAFRGLDSVLGSLAALGYDAEWQDIRASDVRAPHRRERLWIIAYPDTIVGEKRPRIEQQSRQFKNVPSVGKNFFGNSLDFWVEMAREIYRTDDGLSRRLDPVRTECLGNSIVPQIAELIFQQTAFDEWRQS